MTTILITGATGTVGSMLVPLLDPMGVTVRALVRDPKRAKVALGSDIQLATGDFADPGSLAMAMDGVDAVFLACGNVPQQVAHECAVIDAARAATVSRIVKLSARGASSDAPVAFWRWHAAIERHMATSGIPAVVLQPGFLMTNLLAAAPQVREQGMLFAPAGETGIAMIHPADVAAVAAVALTDDTVAPGTHVLTGPEAIGYAQVAAELSAATGRRVGYLDVPPEAARGAMIEAGLPAVVADQVVAVFDTLRAGGQSTTAASVPDLTGRQARTLADFLGGFGAAFGAQPQVLAG